MNVLVKKMSKFGILTVQLIVGAIIMLAAMVALPVGIAVKDASLFANPYVLGAVIVSMLVFGLFAYFLFIRPYFVYRKMPEVLAETDGEFLYIYGKKEAKIPLSAFEDGMVTYHLPFIYSKELIAVLITHLFSDEYGDLILDVPEYGCYKMPFVSNVKETAGELVSFLGGALKE